MDGVCATRTRPQDQVQVGLLSLRSGPRSLGRVADGRQTHRVPECACVCVCASASANANANANAAHLAPPARRGGGRAHICIGAARIITSVIAIINHRAGSGAAEPSCRLGFKLGRAREGGRQRRGAAPASRGDIVGRRSAVAWARLALACGQHSACWLDARPDSHASQPAAWA